MIKGLPYYHYWIFQSILVCPICGASIVRRIRRAHPKPADGADRVEFLNHPCSEHFL